MAVAAIALAINVFFVRSLPKIGLFMLVHHVVGFFAIIILLWVLAPKTPAKVVFTDFQNNGGWPTLCLSVLIGVTGPTMSMLAADCAVHMGMLTTLSPSNPRVAHDVVAEEVKDASRALLQGMVWSWILSAVSGFIMVLTFCVCIGDIKDALASLTKTLKVQRKRAIPLNAILVSFFVTCHLSLINIGSDVAFNAILSLASVALFSTYMISISCLLINRFQTNNNLRQGRWTLGKWGAPINVMSLAFLFFAYVLSFFPLFMPFAPKTFNWSSLIYGAV
ncbi:MAG: hypothetical protein Q9174_003522, partial [Haloplaca sp. 1 TL-2023]